MLTKKISKKIHILEQGESGVLVGDIEQVIVWNMFKIHKLMIIYIVLDDIALKFIMDSRNISETKIPNIKYERSWNLLPKPYLAIFLWALQLVISFENLILIFYIWVLNTTIKSIMKKSQFNQHFATTFMRSIKKMMVLVHGSIFWVHFTKLDPFLQYQIIEFLKKLWGISMLMHKEGGGGDQQFT